MNLAELHKKLVAAARSNPPSDRVPYAFEKRIMARILDKPMEDAWVQWGVALWRGAFACVAISLLAGFLAYLPVKELQADSNELETTVLAAAEELTDTW